MLDPRSIAVGGVGYGPMPMAVLGLWPVDSDEHQAADVFSGTRKKKLSRRDEDQLVEQVLDKWEAIERAAAPSASQAILAAGLPATDPHASPHVDVVETVSGGQLISVSAPIATVKKDASYPPMMPDVAAAAVEARRRNDEAALLMLLMEL